MEIEENIKKLRWILDTEPNGEWDSISFISANCYEGHTAISPPSIQLLENVAQLVKSLSDTCIMHWEKIWIIIITVWAESILWSCQAVVGEWNIQSSFPWWSIINKDRREEAIINN